MTNTSILKKIHNRSLWLIFLLLIATNLLFAQNSISQLKKSLVESTSDSARDVVYENLYKYYKYKNPDSALLYLEQGQEYFITHKYDAGLANMEYWLTTIYSAQGLHDLANKCGEDALNIYTNLNNKKGIASTNNLLGVIDGRLSNLVDATNHFYKALSIFESINDSDGICATYLKLGLTNDLNKNYDIAINFYHKGINLIKLKRHKSDLSYFYNNLGRVYAKMNNFDSALFYFESALNLCKKDSDNTSCLLTLNNMGNIMMAKYHDNEKAMIYFNQALDMAKKSKLPEEYTSIIIGISSTYSEKDKSKAIDLLQEALKISREIKNLPLQMDALNGMIEIYKSEKNYEQAMKLFEQSKEIEDSIFNINKTRALSSQAEVYEQDKLKAQIQKLEESKQTLKNRKNIILFGLLLSSGISIFVILLYQKTRKLNKLLTKREHELEELNIDRNKLFSIIGHDLKGPIGNLPSLIAICRNEFLPKEQLQKILEMMEISANASFRTLNNLLNWGKTQMVGEAFKPTQIMVNKVISNEISLLKISIENKSLTVLNTIPIDTEVHADPNEIEFVFRNILSNAVKYSNRYGVIELSQLPNSRPNRVTFAIKDYGCGISKERITKIFDQFVASMTGSENEKGNGIALKLCKEFVVKNHGDIWVESEEKISTTFFLTLDTNSPKA